MKQNKLLKLAVSGIAALAAVPAAAATINVTGNITTNTTWTSNNEYILTDIIYVNNGATLTIQPGTVIKGEARTSPATYDPGTLVITRDGTLIANGTPANPIIFTSVLDTNPKTAPRAPIVSGVRTSGEWGGIILLGRAPIAEDRYSANNLLLPGTEFIEGLPEPLITDPVPNMNGVYGGNDPHDSSGSLKYVQIRHGGTNLAAANEINGLTFGGVGDGTVIDYIEVYNNLDDGYEFFGGTVNAKHLISLFNDDDSFDWDEGFTGQLQFILSVEHQSTIVNSNRGIEADGDDNNLRIRPYSIPAIFNATWIGGGIKGGSRVSGEQNVLHFRENTGGKVFNSIITEYERARAVVIENENATGTVTSVTGHVANKADLDSKERLDAGELVLRNNIFWNAAAVSGVYTNTVAQYGLNAWDQGLFEVLAAFDSTPTNANNNAIVDPFFLDATFTNSFGSTRDTAGAILLKPFAIGQVVNNIEPVTGPFFESTTYKGAIDPTPSTAPWTKGWSVGSKLGYYAE